MHCLLTSLSPKQCSWGTPCPWVAHVSCPQRFSGQSGPTLCSSQAPKPACEQVRMEAGRVLCSHTWSLGRWQVSLSLGQRMFFRWLWRRWGGELVGVRAGVRVEGSEDVKDNFHLVNLRVSVTSSDFCIHTENQLKCQSAMLQRVRASFVLQIRGRHKERQFA